MNPIPDEKITKTIKIKNRGTGAGGKNTTKTGGEFETLTDNGNKLMVDGYVKNILNNKSKFGYYLSKKIETKEIIFLIKSGLNSYLKKMYNIEVFREPDEAYLIRDTENDKILIKILEKKNQNNEGSVETKLWAGPSLKREYELVLGDQFQVSYGYCLSPFLKAKFTDTSNIDNKKYIILKQILDENKISVLFGGDADYFKKLNDWIHA